MGASSEYRAKIEEARKKRDTGGSYVKAWIRENKGPEIAADMRSRLKTWADEHDAFAKSYYDRFSGRNADWSYIDYVGDAGDYYKTASEQSKKLNDTAGKLLADLQQNSYIYGDDFVKAASQMLTSGRELYTGAEENAKTDMDFWAMFEPKEEQIKAGYDTPEKLYDAWRTENKYQTKHEGKNRDEIERAILYAEDEQEADWLRQKHTEMFDLKSELERYDPEFEEKSKYKSTRTETRKAYGHEYGIYANEEYEWINGNGDVTSYYAFEDDDVGGYPEWYTRNFEYLTDDQIAVYNYYVNTKQNDKAEEYLYSLQPSLNQQAGKQLAAGLKGDTLAELLFAIPYGLENFKSGVNGLVRSFFGDDTKVPPSAIQYAADEVREDLGNIDLLWYDFSEGKWKETDIFGNSLGQGLFDFGTTTANMVPSILTSTAISLINPTAGAVAGTTLLSSSAAGNAYQEKINLGYSVDQARTYGYLVGISEGVLQYALGGVSKLGKGGLKRVFSSLDKIDNVFARFAKTTGGQWLLSGASEGLEEGLQSVIEPYIWQAVSGEEAQIDWEETLYNSLIGFMSGSTFEGAEISRQNAAYQEIGKPFVKADNTKAIGTITELAKTMDGVSNLSLGKQAEAVGKKPTAKNVGKLVTDISNAVNAQNSKELSARLAEAGFDAKKAEQIADAVITLRSDYESLTRKQMSLLEEVQSDERVLSAIEEVLDTEGSAAYQRNAVLQEAMESVRSAAVGEKVATDPHNDNAGQPGVNGENVDPVAQLARETVEARYAAEDGVGVDGISADGRAIYQDQAVDVVDIDTAGDGKVLVKLADGRSVDATTLEYEDSGEAELWRVIGQYAEDVDSARALLQEYRNGDLDAYKYARGIEEAFLFGKLNLSPKEMEIKDSMVNDLSAAQRNVAYTLGKRAGEREVQQRQDKVAANRKGIATPAEQARNDRKKGQLHFEGDRESLTDRQKVSLQACEVVAKALGIQVYVFESEKVNGKRVGENGWYDPKDGSIHIDLHAGQNGEGVMVFTLAHELTHFIRDWSPKKFRILSGFLAEQYAKKGQSVADLVRDQQRRAEENGRSLSFEEAHEEWVADSMETMLTDGTIVEKLAMLQAKDKGLVEKIKTFLNDFGKRLKDAYKSLDPRTKEGRIVADMVDAAAELQNLFADALLDAGENFRSAEKNTTGEGGDIRLSAREETAYKEFSSKVNTVVNQAISGKGNVDGKVQVMDIMPVGPKLAAMVAASSGNEIDISDRNIALNTGDVWHEYKRHSSISDEVSRDQVAFTKRQFQNAIKCMISPDVVETIFRDTNNPTQKQSFAYAKKTSRGHYVVVEAVGGKKNPNIYPVMILQFSKAKWDKMMRERKTLGEILLEGDLKKLNALDITKNKKSRVTAAQFASYEAIANILRSPQLNDIVAQQELTVKENDSTEKRSSSRSGDVSDRTMLVDLFEQMVTDSNEYRALQNYKKNIDQMLALEEKVDRLSEEIKRVSFAEGPRNMEYLDNLKQQRKQAVAELNKFDNILLGLEKSGVLRAMIERNRQMIQQETRDKTREYYRQKNEAREAEIRQYYRESRRKAVERHDQAQVRQKIKRTVRDLWKLQETAPKDRRTKEELREFVDSAIKAADMVWLERYDEYDMVRNGIDSQYLRGDEARLMQECKELLEKHLEISDADVDTRWDIDTALQQAKDKAALDKELSKKMKILRDAGVFAEEFKRHHEFDAGQLVDNLVESYKKLKGTQSPYLMNAYNEKLPEKLEEIKMKIGAKPVRNMTLQELEMLYDAYSAVLHVVRSANQTFADQKAGTLYEKGIGVVGELKLFSTKVMGRKFVETMRKAGWDNLTPDSAFRRIGSDTLLRLYKNMLMGQNVVGRDVAEAKAYWKEQAKKYGAYNWDMDKRKTFVDSTGKKFSLSLGQMMSVYALSQRKQAEAHLDVGGVMLDPTENYVEKLVDKVLPKVITDAGTYKLDGAVREEIFAELKEEQKSFVEATQKYLSNEMAEKGNVVSMALYGIRLFKEKNYFPIRVAKQGVYVSTELIDQNKLKNSGFTKDVTPDAKNAVVISDYSKVWTGHVKQMSDYHGMTLPMEDMDRVLNFGKTMDQFEADRTIPITKGMTDGQRYMLLKNRSISVSAKVKTDALRRIEESIGRSVVEAEIITDTNRKKLFRKIGDEFGVFKEYSNEDVKLTFNFSKGNLRESVQKQRKNYTDFAKMLSCFDEIIESAIGIEVHNRNDEGYKPDPTLKNTYVLVSAFEDGSNIIPVKLEIKEFVDKDNSLYVAIALESIKKDEVVKQGNTENGVTQNSRSSVIKIADLFSKINPIDKSFLKYIPTQFFSQDITAEDNSVSAALQNIYGAHAENYVRELMQQLNGGVRSDPAESISGKMFRNFKKAKVAASLSVWIQQWTSIFRAMAHIDFWNFVHTPKVGKARDEAVAEMKKYAGIAIIKEMGGYSTGMGSSLHDYITMAEPESVNEHLREFRKHPGKRIDALTGYLPGRADENTWMRIWLAAKKEAHKAHPELKGGTDAFYDVVSERFTEVINRTQVYDSTLSKSALMRSKSGFAQMLTQFAAEPTMVLNMTVDAMLEHKRTGKIQGKTLFAITASVIVNALCSSLIYAMRDDDEEETFTEKYFGTLTENLIDGFNPLTYMPIIRDMWSIFQGYDVERSDMALWADLVASLEDVVRLANDPDADDKKKADAWWEIADGIFDITGLPVRNVRREINAVRNLFMTLEKDKTVRDTTAKSLDDKLQESVISTVPLLRLLAGETKAEKLVEALVAGDIHYANRLRATYKTEDAANNAIVRVVKEQFEDGALSENNAVRYLTEYVGKTEQEAQEKVTKWRAEKETGVAYDDIKESFISGKITEEQAKEMYITYGGQDEENAEKKVTYWKFKKEHPESELDQSPALDFVEFAEPAGISLDIYTRYVEATANLESDKDKDGKTIANSKREKVWAEIHKLPISKKQKDALHYAAGYKESSLDEAPWH